MRPVLPPLDLLTHTHTHTLPPLHTHTHTPYPHTHTHTHTPHTHHTHPPPPPHTHAHWQSSLSELMEKLNSSSPHFIRCIKPNSTKLPNSFNTDYVIRQLRCVGVMETTRIRQSGYPVRFEYGEFLTRYM